MRACLRAWRSSSPCEWGQGSWSASARHVRPRKRCEAGHGTWQNHRFWGNEVCICPWLGMPPQNFSFREEGSRSRGVTQPRAAMFPPRHLHPALLVGADVWWWCLSTGRSRRLHPRSRRTIQRRPLANPRGAKLAVSTDSAAAGPSQRTDLRIVSGDDASGNSWSGGARVSAALEMQRSQLEEYPEAVTHTLRQNMARALRSDPRAGQGAAEFIRRFASFSHHWDLGHVAPALAEVWNALEMQDVSTTRAKVGLLLMAIARLRWDLAQLVLHLPGPPLEAMPRSVDRDALFNHSRLAESLWGGRLTSRDGALLQVAFRQQKGIGKKGKVQGKDGKVGTKISDAAIALSWSFSNSVVYVLYPAAPAGADCFQFVPVLLLQSRVLFQGGLGGHPFLHLALLFAVSASGEALLDMRSAT